MTNTLDLEGSKDYRRDEDDDIQQQSSFISNVHELDLN